MAKIELEYLEKDGLLYPCIETSMEHIDGDLGKYGILRLRYLHERRHELYRELLFTGKLAQHCADIEQQAFVIAGQIVTQYLLRNPPPDEGMERIQAFTQAQMLVDKIVTAELIYQ